MKIAIYILTIFLITACSSKNEAYNQLNSNKSSYIKLKMTKTALLKSAIVYATYNKDSKSFKVELNSRDREDISLQKCLINKKEAIIEPDSSSYRWQNSFIVYSTNSSKGAKLNCTLTSGDRFSITF